jgi:hypothetical protein
MAMMAMTTNSSMSVNAGRRRERIAAGDTGNLPKRMNWSARGWDAMVWATNWMLAIEMVDAGRPRQHLSNFQNTGTPDAIQ